MPIAIDVNNSLGARYAREELRSHKKIWGGLLIVATLGFIIASAIRFDDDEFDKFIWPICATLVGTYSVFFFWQWYSDNAMHKENMMDSNLYLNSYTGELYGKSQQ